MKKHIRYGEIDKNGVLKFPQKDLDTQQFLKNNKGKSIILTIEAFKTGSSPNMDAYYRKVVLPIITEAFKNNGEYYNTAQAEGVVMDIFGIKKRYSEMNKTEKADYITRLKLFAASELYTFIPEPK